MDRELIELREYEQYHDLISISLTTYEKFKTQLERSFDINKISYNNKLINLQIRAKFWIGMVSIENYTILVKPKFENSKMIYMLFTINDELRELFPNKTENIDFDNQFIKEFLRSFFNKTIQLLKTSRKKMYTFEQSAKFNVKGKIKVDKSILHHFKGKFGLITESLKFTFDNFLNQIIKFTIMHLKPLFYDDFRSELNTLLGMLSDVKLIHTLDITEIENILYDRTTQEYRHIHQICIFILKNNFVGISSGKKYFKSFFINTWNIYEKFLLHIFDKYLDNGYSVYSQISQYNDESEDIYPDIVIQKNNDIYLLIDAKYKREVTSNNKHQGGNYIRRLMIPNTIPKFRNCLLIYPKSDSNYYFCNDRNWRYESRQGTVYWHSFDLSKADDEEYRENWVRKIQTKLLEHPDNF